MDIATVVEEVDAWPVDQRIQLVGTLWDSLISAGAEPELTDEQAAELDRRLDAAEADPGNVLTWEQIQTFVRSPR
jgi:putative addiction module component (TIGR02574 family)